MFIIPHPLRILNLNTIEVFNFSVSTARPTEGKPKEVF